MAIFQLKVQIFFIILCTVHYTISNPPMIPKIFGGHECKPEDYPFIVAVEIDDLICVGSLLKMDLVLTTAACAFAIEIGILGTGIVKSGFKSDHEQVRNVTEVKQEDSYSFFPIFSYQDYLLYNIGLLKLNSPFTPSEVTKLAKLPDVGSLEKCITAVVVGLGAGAEEETPPHNAEQTHFKCLDVTISSEKNCATSEDALKRVQNYYDYVFCGSATTGEGKEAKGDWGGPVICDGAIVGLVTAPKVANVSIGYLKVEAYLPFLNENMIHFKGGKVVRGKNRTAANVKGKPKEDVNVTSAPGQGAEIPSKNDSKAPAATTPKSSSNRIWTRTLNWHLFFAISLFFL